MAPHLSTLASLGARQQIEQQLRSVLKTSHEEDIKYIPCINKCYPKPFRQHATSLFCTAGFLPCEQYPTQDISIDIPQGILDDAPLAVMLGGVAWFAACLSSRCKDSNDEHDGGWHWRFRCILEDCFETCTDYPFPKLPAHGSAFCMELQSDRPGELGDEESKRILKIFTAVAIFLGNKNILLQCCRRCQTLYTRFSSGAIHSTSINESSVDTDASGTPPNLHSILLISDRFMSFRSRHQHEGKSPYICGSHWDGRLHEHRT